ncbi:MAG: hypothetical protein ACLGG9_11440 [Thermoleophilia bacterium]|jgi:hypothetical protein
MIAAFRSQWVKLTRRSFAVGAIAPLVGFSVAITAVGILRVNETGEHIGPAGSLTLADLTAGGGWLAGMGAASAFLGLISLAIFASDIAGEFTTGTIRSVLVLEPHRLRVLAGKTACLAAFLAGGLMIAGLATGVAAFVVAGSESIDTSAWTTTDALSEGLSIYVNVLMSCVVWGVFGMALGMITRSSAIAIAAGAGYFLLGERLLLNSLWPSTEEWLPAGVLSALAEGGNPAIGYGTAIVLAAAYGLGAFLLAATAFARRDITA